MPFLQANEVTSTSVHWLWPGRLPSGHLAMMDGDPGLGKSFVTIDVCARVTTGQPFGDGAPGIRPAAAVILSGEDGLRDTILGRLRAAGADLSRVRVFERQPGEARFRLPGSVKRLEDVVERTGARYVVFDPITAFMESSVGLCSDASVRDALEPLAELAARHDCVVHLVRHLNKKGGNNPLYRGLHTIGFNALCRVSWVIGPDPRVSRQFVLAQTKNNLDQSPPSLAYTIEPADNGIGRIVWRGTNATRSEEVLAGWNVQTRNRLRAQDFLRALLQSGPRTSRDIRAAAKQHRVSEHQLRQAREELNIRVTRVNVGKADQKAFWVMPDQKFTRELTDTPFLDGWIRQWDEQYSEPVEEPDQAAFETATDPDDQRPDFD